VPGQRGHAFSVSTVRTPHSCGDVEAASSGQKDEVVLGASDGALDASTENSDAQKERGS